MVIAPRQGFPTGAPLFGRVDELARIERACRSAAAGSGSTVGIEGEAGTGKTSLLRAAADAARAAGFSALSVAMSAAESSLAWAGLDTLLADVDPGGLDRLPEGRRDALLAATGRVRGDVDPSLVAFALSELLGHQGSAGPFLVVVDDLQWLDAATAAALAYALHRCPSRPMVALVAWRTGSGVALPMEVDRLAPQATQRLVLGGVMVPVLREVVLAAVGVALSRSDLVRLHQHTGGNPLHAIEIARTMAGGRAFDRSMVPTSLRAVIAQRLTALDPTSAAVLETAALAARPTLGLLARVHPSIDVEAACLAGEAGRLIAISGDVVSFDHPLLRAGVLDGLGELATRQRHRALADAVGDGEQRAVHLAAATVQPDDVVAAELEEAADACFLRGVMATASERFRDAARLSTDPADRDRRLLGAGRALAADADWASAFAVLEGLAAAGADAAVRARATSALVLPVANLQGLDEVERAIEAALAVAEDPMVRAEHFGQAVRLHQFRDMAKAVGAARRGLDDARRLGDPQALASATGQHENARSLAGEPASVAVAAAAARAWTGGWTLLSPPLALAELQVWTDQPDVIAAIEGAVAEARARGALLPELNLRSMLADAHFRRGRWSEAVAQLSSCIDDEDGLFELGQAMDLVELAGMLAPQGAEAEVRSLVDPILGGDGAAPPTITMLANAAAGSLALGLGRAAEAAAHLTAAIDGARAASFHGVRGVRFRRDVVEALLLHGDLDRAGRESDALGADARRNEVPSALAEAQAAAGAVQAARGELDRAEATLSEAALVQEQLHLPFDHARTMLVAGAGRRGIAAARFAAASATFRSLGAGPWLGRSEAEAERLGAPAGDRGQLTGTERQVAERAARGRTNAEIAVDLFVSVRTVESNLTRVYRKLGVRSRTELVRRLDEPR